MKTQLVARGFELSAELEKYTQHKLATIRRRVPRAARPEVLCTVQFIKKRTKAAENKTCRLTLILPHEKLEAEETTQHMYAALDIATEHMVQQLRDYKGRHRRRNLGVGLPGSPGTTS